jgi:hypothetical protein
MLTLKLGLKDFLTSCLFYFQVYIWSTTIRYNMDKYLEKTKEKKILWIH